MIEVRENASYYAWTVYVHGDYAGMIVKEPGGGYTCARGGLDSDRRFPTVDAAAQAIAGAVESEA